jgi:putative transposase
MRRRTGRPSTPADIRTPIRTMSDANPLWGAPRIHGELRKVGIVVSQSTVAKYMHRDRRPPSQTWRTFVANHVGQVMAADLVSVVSRFTRIAVLLPGARQARGALS